MALKSDPTTDSPASQPASPPGRRWISTTIICLITAIVASLLGYAIGRPDHQDEAPAPAEQAAANHIPMIDELYHSGFRTITTDVVIAGDQGEPSLSQVLTPLKASIRTVMCLELS